MIQRIMAILAVALIVPDIYIYKMFIVRLTDSLLWRCLYFVPSILLLTGLALVFFLFVLPKLLFMIISLLGLPFHVLLHWPKTPFTLLGVAAAALLAGIIIYGSAIGKTRFEVKEVDFHASNLPAAFNGYRIVQLSDIHIGSWRGNEEAMQEAVN